MNQSLLILALLATAISLQLAHAPLSPFHEDTLDLAALRAAQLAKHNTDRALHGCPSLKLNDTLNAAAQKFAETLAANHKFSHSAQASKGLYGENLFYAWSSAASNVYTNGKATDSWYSENKNYNYLTGPLLSTLVTGHFTAMIWKSVTSVGFGYSTTSENNGYAIYVVANYSPTPNVYGQYIKNVPAPLPR